MNISDRLKKLKKGGLQNLADQLKLKSWSGLKKSLLIDHIIKNANEQDITALLNRDSLPVADNAYKKIPWWKRHKIASLIAIIGLIGSIASIIALIKPSSIININADKVAEIIEKKYSGISSEKLRRLKEKVTELESALKDGKSGNTQERKEALTALKKGDATKAQELFKKVIEENKVKIEKDNENLAENYKNLGNAYFIGLKYNKALGAYNNAIEIKPNYYEAWKDKGIVLSNLGRHDESIKAFNKVLKITPKSHEDWNNKALALYALGRPDEALKTFNKALEIKPDYSEAWAGKGGTLSRLGHHNKAIEAFNEALDIKPDYYDAWILKGLTFNALGRNDEALEAFNKSIEIKPDYHLAWSNKGVALAALGRNDEALEAYNKCIEIKPNYHIAWINKGNAFSALGRYDEALKAYDKAIEIQPDFHMIHQAWNNKGAALYYLGRHDEALEAYNKAIAIQPDSHEAWYNKACLYSLQKDKRNALNCLRKAIEKGLNDLAHIKKDTDLDFIRNEKEFQEIISKI
jgi:tetratricopeptide (TPR) repeat protein